MSQEIEIEGKPFVSSKRASEISGYAQDYIGQLARKTLIDARRVGGLWYVSMESLSKYQKDTENIKQGGPTAPLEAQDPETLVLLDGKEYVSTSRAAELTGYNPDYVGQLARSETIASQQIGNRWYVEKQKLLSHKEEKDSLLAAVQSEAVGLKKIQKPEMIEPEYLAKHRFSGSLPLLNYTNDHNDLVPVMPVNESDDKSGLLVESDQEAGEDVNEEEISIPIPIHKKPFVTKTSDKRSFSASDMVKSDRKSLLTALKEPRMPLIVGSIAAIAVVAFTGTRFLNSNGLHSVNIASQGSDKSLQAAVLAAFQGTLGMIEPFVSHELDYYRSSGK